MYGVTFPFSNCKAMETSAPNINFWGDDTALIINQFYWNFVGFVFATNLALLRGVAGTFQKFEK